MVDPAPPGRRLLRGARTAAVAATALLLPCAAHADGGRLLGEDAFAVREGGDLAVDGGVVVGLPAALPAGLSTGIGGGVTRGCGCRLAYGARASWSTATESSTAWSVTHSDLRLRASGAIRHAAGRGMLSLRLGVGATLVHETRDRNQGMRAGLTGDELQTTAWRAVPAADLEGVIALHVAGPWLAVASAGPTLDVLPDRVRGGFTAQLGVAWQP